MTGVRAVKINDDEALGDLQWQTDNPVRLRALLLGVGVWLPYSIYRRWPVMLPWAVRDLASRPTGHSQGLDEWGSPNASGYFRDDNSMVKGLVRSLPIHGPECSPYAGRTLGTGFVAAHIWRFTNGVRQFTTRDPDLYSFLPNIIWLPKALAKRSDQEGGPVQRSLQSLSYELFRNIPVLEQHATMVDHCWSRLDVPTAAGRPVHHAETNWFIDLPRFSLARARSVDAVRTGIGEVLATGAPARKVISTRYTRGLPLVERERLSELRARLAQFE